MSAATKSKRGEAGQAKAKANPFRINGWQPDWNARRLGCHHVPPATSGGSTTMRGMLGGVLAERLGMGSIFGSRLEQMLAHAQARCTDPLLKDEAA